MLLKKSATCKCNRKGSPSKNFLIIKGIAGTIIGGFALYILFRRVSPFAIAAELTQINRIQLVKAIIFIFLSYVFRTAMWKKLLEQFHSYPYGTLFQATMIGYLINNILPARLGDVARGIWLCRMRGGNSGSVFGSLALERVMDITLILIILGVSMLYLGLYQKWLVISILVLAGGVVVFFIIGALLRRLVLCDTARFPISLIKAKEWIAKFAHFKSLRTIMSNLTNAASVINMIRGFSWAVGTWFVTYWGLYFTLDSLNLTEQLGHVNAALVLCVASLGIAVPSLPASLGTYQAAFVFGGMLVGVSETQAITASLIYQGLWVGVTSTLGLIALAWELVATFRQKLKNAAISF